MTRCECCGRGIADGFRVCPMCEQRYGVRSDVAAACYPQYRKRGRNGLWRSHLTWILIALTAAAVIVNICVGPPAWSIYAVLGAYIQYHTFLSITLIEANAIRKFLTVMISVCLLLLMIEVISSSPGMESVQFVIPILLYSALIICGVIYFAGFRSQKSHIVPILFVMGLSFSCMLVSILLYNVMKWPTIVMASVSLCIILLSVIFFRKPVAAEIRKKIHA